MGPKNLMPFISVAKFLEMDMSQPGILAKNFGKASKLEQGRDVNSCPASSAEDDILDTKGCVLTYVSQTAEHISDDTSSGAAQGTGSMVVPSSSSLTESAPPV